MVTASDYARWKELYGTTEPAADGNGDGTVNAADYTVWRNNLGLTWLDVGGGGMAAGGGGLADIVPEPSGLFVALLSIGAELAIRRQRWRT